MPVSDILGNTAKEYPLKIAINFGDKKITYRDFNRKVDNLSQGLLDLGLSQGQMVSVLLGNSPEFLYTYFAVTRVGGTVVPINPLYKGNELKYILNDCQAIMLITIKPLAPLIQSIWGSLPSLKKLIIINEEFSHDNIVSFEQLINTDAEPVNIDINDDEIASCLYTSGTTGRPKGALLSHGNLIFDCVTSLKRIKYTSQDIHICVLPLFHSFSQMASMLAPIYTGGSIVIIPQFQPDIVLREIHDNNATVLCGIPAIFNAMLPLLAIQNEYDLSKLRICLCGGSPMPVEIIRMYEEKYNINILEGNGPTETSPVSYVNPPELRKVGSVGPPLEGVRVKIFDNDDLELPKGEIGEICIKGANVMQGYLNQPEATAEAMKVGWFHTGDLGKVDEDGYVYIVDRKKDMLIVGGLNVYPREVEDCLYTHPKVSDVAVIGIPDEQRGEVPLAFISLKTCAVSSVAEIVIYCRERLANYKCPRKIVFMDKLPRNATGKVDKKQLREVYSLGMIS